MRIWALDCTPMSPHLSHLSVPWSLAAVAAAAQMGSSTPRSVAGCHAQDAQCTRRKADGKQHGDGDSLGVGRVPLFQLLGPKTQEQLSWLV